MLEYSFLTLSLLLSIPAVVVAVLRPDLRGVMGWMALASIPFAFTERLFYPDYWEPKFIFDLVNVIGFGIEDILFVAGIAAFASTAWAAVTGLRMRDDGAPKWSRAALMLGVCFAAVAVLALVGVPMIYGAPIIMLILGAVICVMRPDLLVPGLGGAIVTTVCYTAVCLALMAIIPGVFELDWKTEKFLDLWVFGVPLEEILYAATAGWIGTLFYPWVTGGRFAPADR